MWGPGFFRGCGEGTVPGGQPLVGMGCWVPRGGEGEAGVHELRWQSRLALHFRGYCKVAGTITSLRATSFPKRIQLVFLEQARRTSFL